MQQFSSVFTYSICQGYFAHDISTFQISYKFISSNKFEVQVQPNPFLQPRFQYPFQYPFPVPPPWNEQADNADVKAERKLMRLLREVDAKAADFENHVRPLVERFDIEPFPDFSAKCANFAGLVLFCIDAKFCKKKFVGKL